MSIFFFVATACLLGAIAVPVVFSLLGWKRSK